MNDITFLTKMSDFRHEKFAVPKKRQLVDAIKKLPPPSLPFWQY